MKLIPHKSDLSTITVCSLRVAVIVVFLLNTACGGKNKEFEGVPKGEIIPDLRTTGVTTFISDSGMIRYKIITAEWLMYNSVDSPYWEFNKGIYLEKFDTLFRIDSSIKADTAYYYQDKKTWELRNNVHIRSQKGDKFDTDLLFWNQKDETMYSDKFIRIEQTDKILEGYGFISNQEMTEYQIYNNTGIFDVEDTQTAAPATTADNLPNDTVDIIQNDTVNNIENNTVTNAATDTVASATTDTAKTETITAMPPE